MPGRANPARTIWRWLAFDGLCVFFFVLVARSVQTIWLLLAGSVANDANIDSIDFGPSSDFLVFVLLLLLLLIPLHSSRLYHGVPRNQTHPFGEHLANLAKCWNTVRSKPEASGTNSTSTEQQHESELLALVPGSGTTPKCTDRSESDSGVSNATVTPSLQCATNVYVSLP